MAASLTIRLAGLSTALVLPLWLLVATRWPQSLDFVFYSLALDQFSAQVWTGEWYPRWLTDVNAGLGSPAFLFYSPGAYWLGSALEWLAPLDPHGFGRLILLMQLAVIAAGLSAYRWLRRHWSEPEARAGALAYAAGPYLALKIYSSFGVSELWVIALLPMLLLAVEEGRFWALAAGYAVLALVHLPTCVVFAGVPVAYAGWTGAVRAGAWKGAIHPAVRTVGAGCCALCLAAFYLIPAAVNRPFIVERHFLRDRFDYRQNFSHPDAVVAAVVTLLPVLWLVVRLPTAQRWTLWREAGFRFWVGATVAAGVMMTTLSVRLWEAVWLLQYLQFPFRFFTAILPGLAWLERRLLAMKPFPAFRPVVTAVAYAVVIVVAGLPAFVADQTPLRRFFDQRTVPAPEYQTRWMAESKLAPWALPPALVRSPAASITSGDGRVEVEEWGSRRIVLRTAISSPQAAVRLKTSYFPGWTSGNQVTQADGLLGVVVPGGQERVELSRRYFPGERAGLAVSLVTLGVMLVGVAVARWGSPTSPAPQ